MGQNRTGMVQIFAKMVCHWNRRCFSGWKLPRGIGDQRFDAPLEIFGVFHPASGEHLDSVVLVRVVRSGDHHTRVEIQRCGEVRDSRCGRNADALYLRARNAGAVGQFAFDPLAGFEQYVIQPSRIHIKMSTYC